MSLDHESVVKYYKREMLNLTNFTEYSGIWQFHQAANVLGCCIQSVYPHTPVTSLRQDMNWLILPMDLDGPNIATIVQIMWSKSNIRSFGYNHFVSLVDADETMHIVNVNMLPIGYCDELSKNVPIEIDLTKDMNEKKVADEGYLEKDYDMKKEINETTGKN